jgi:L-fuculose-phosphate aldolase
METIEHFAKISLVARLLGGERLLSRDEVSRLQGLRGSYGIAAPAPICPDPADAAATECQVVLAPDSPAGQRLVPERFAAVRTPDGDAEIRLTYRELTALIEDAVRNLR